MKHDSIQSWSVPNAVDISLNDISFLTIFVINWEEYNDRPQIL